MLYPILPTLTGEPGDIAPPRRRIHPHPCAKKELWRVSANKRARGASAISKDKVISIRGGEGKGNDKRSPQSSTFFGLC